MATSNNEQRGSGICLPLKATPSTAAVISSTVSCSQSSQQSSALSSVVPSSHSSNDIIAAPKDNTISVNDNEKPTQNQQHHHSHHFNALARVSNILQKSRDLSPPRSPVRSHIGSPMSSTDSLASLIERQEKNKISNPSHQLFNSNPYKHEKKLSGGSMFSLISSGSLHRRSSSNTTAPTIKSPLNNQLKSHDHVSTSRRLTPNHSNPTHIHSSPNVKESKKVYLEYDPVSKRKVLNTYEIVKEIGRGEHGKVKLAKEISSGDYVAIKIVDRKGKQKFGKALKLGSSEEEKIRKEIAIMKKINHPNVVQLKEVLDDINSRKIYLVLEFLEKGEVKWQKSPGVPLLTLPESMKVFRDVILGLEYLHYQGIIHRDIKPANLLIAKDDSVKISDFGVSFASSLKNGEEQNDYDLAKTAGTPAFFAPEICQPLTNFNFDDNNNGDDFHIVYPKITSKIDIWALGVTLYCLLFGSMPFWATNEFELFKVICDKPLEFPSEFPENYEWTEEDKFEAKNLLFKMLEKDSAKRISIKEIKRHPFVLRNLSVEECRIFSTVQKACENKIEVSNAEVRVAVTGIASKLRKGFAKALKFATGIGSELNSQSSSSAVSMPNVFNRKSHSRTTSSDSKRLHVNEIEKLNNSTSTLIESLNPSAKKSPVQSTSSNSRSRMRSIESAAETKATVEGDLFLKQGSAFNSLSHIMNDDKRRSSMSSGTYNSSALSEGYDGSNDSSFSKIGSQLVSLPVNASFASLDSVYLDNYATAYYTEVKDARNPRGKLDPPNIPFPSSSSLSDDGDESGEIIIGQPKVNKETSELFQKMNDFSLNKSAEPKHDNNIAPHEPTVAKFDLNDETDDTEDSEDSETSSVGCFYGDGLDNHEYDDRIVFGRQESNDQLSEFSVPSMLVRDLAPSIKVEDEDEDEDADVVQPIKVIKSNYKTPITGPKYSFFETSETEDSDQSSSITQLSEGDLNVEEFEFYRSDEEDNHDSESSSDESSEGEELLLSFGNRNRARTNTISTSTLPTTNTPLNQRPTSEPPFNADSGYTTKTPTMDKISVLRPPLPKPERVTSPLSKNAPHTPFSTINAHLIPKTVIHPHEFVNHYTKIQPQVAYHLDNDVNGHDEINEGTARGRSNSITVGILEHQRD